MSRSLLLGSLAGATLALALIALTLGPAPLTPGDVLAGLLWAPADDPRAIIVREIRLPRVALGGVIGASLGLAGAALQGLLRNPLAEPGVIGVSASASLGAVVALYFGLTSISVLALPGMAMAGALVSTLVLLALARRASGVLTLILAGVALSSLATALTALALNLAPNPFAVTEMITWLLGSLRDRSLTDLALATPFAVAGWLLLGRSGRGLEALSLGEDQATSLGIHLGRLRLMVIGGTTLAVGASVAVAGSIGFVGLVVPHLLRPLVGHAPGALLLPSALGGAALVVAADMGVRLVSGAPELNLGVVTALLGAPFFLVLVLRESGGWQA